VYNLIVNNKSQLENDIYWPKKKRKKNEFLSFLCKSRRSTFVPIVTEESDESKRGHKKIFYVILQHLFNNYNINKRNMVHFGLLCYMATVKLGSIFWALQHIKESLTAHFFSLKFIIFPYSNNNRRKE
jgi:uncharacterized alpha/beta hydrolase family protein